MLVENVPCGFPRELRRYPAIWYEKIESRLIGVNSGFDSRDFGLEGSRFSCLMIRVWYCSEYTCWIFELLSWADLLMQQPMLVDLRV